MLTLLVFGEKMKYTEPYQEYKENEENKRL